MTNFLITINEEDSEAIVSVDGRVIYLLIRCCHSGFCLRHKATDTCSWTDKPYRFATFEEGCKNLLNCLHEEMFK